MSSSAAGGDDVVTLMEGILGGWAREAREKLRPLAADADDVQRRGRDVEVAFLVAAHARIALASIESLVWDHSGRARAIEYAERVVHAAMDRAENAAIELTRFQAAEAARSLHGGGS